MSSAALAIQDRVHAALALRAAGRLEEALDMLSPPAPYSSDFYTIRAEIQTELGRVQEAAGSYFTVVAAEPQNAIAHLNLAQCLERLQRWDEAAHALQAALRIDPHRDHARLALAGCLLHLNRLEEALVNFDQCWSDAARSRTLFGRAVALQLLHRHDEAEASYQRLLASEPNYEEALSNLIALLFETHDLDGVQHYALRLLELSPLSLPALQALAAAKLARGEYEAAAHYCGCIVDSNPACVEAWHNLRFASGRVMSALNRPGAQLPTSGRK